MRSRALVLILSAALLSWAAAPAAPAATLTVNVATDTDDGDCTPADCSLREAVAEANGDTIRDEIEFGIGTGAATITLSSGLSLSQPAVVDGWSQPGWSGAPLIRLGGSEGLFVQAADVELRGLRLGHLGAGTGADLVLRGNEISGGGSGLDIENANAVIGGAGPDDGNDITAALGISGPGATVQGNELGVVTAFAAATFK